MNDQLNNTVKALALVQSYKGQAVYGLLIDLVESLQQDIRLANDTEPETTQIFRNQGGIHWLGQLVKQMKSEPRVRTKVHDGAYTDI